MVRSLRRLLRLGLLAGIGVGVLKILRGRKSPDPWADSWVSTGPPGGTRPSPAPLATTAKPAPSEAEKADADGSEGEKSDSGKSAPNRAAAKSTRTGPARKLPTGKAEDPPGERLWVQANDGVCPQSHPVKAKLSSKIFHIPGGRNYKSTKADRCYPDEASAQADGLRPALR